MQTVFGYAVRDNGVLLVFAAASLALGVVLWAVAGNPDQYGGLANAIITGYIIFIILEAYGWVQQLYTARNMLVPLVLNTVLVAWIWSARPKA